MAAAIITNAKAQRVSVCNAAETLLVDREIAADFLPLAQAALAQKGVRLRGCAAVRAILNGVEPADEDDWAREYLDLILAVRVVDGLDDAIAHITRYSTGHSECIVTQDDAAGAKEADPFENHPRFDRPHRGRFAFLPAGGRFGRAV